VLPGRAVPGVWLRVYRDSLTISAVLCGTAGVTTAGCGSGSGEPIAVAPLAAGCGSVAQEGGTTSATGMGVMPGDAGAAPGPEAVVGTLVDITTRRPLSGRTVAIGTESTTTDAHGEFTFESVPSTYDAVVADGDGTAVTVYQGLQRRDPMLTHRPSPVTEATTHSADLTGTVSNGGSYPLGRDDLVSVYFFATEVDEHVSIGGLLAPARAGPAYGPMHLSWNGPGCIHGRVFALGSFPQGDGGARSLWTATQELDVATGGSARVNLALGPAQTQRLTGAVQTPVGTSVAFIQVAYRLPAAGGVVALLDEETSASSFDYVVPDLTSLGGAPCVTAGTAWPYLVTMKCGVTAEASDLVVVVRAPPVLSMPTAGASMTKDGAFSWSPFDGGVHELSLESEYPSRTAPNVDVYTSATSSRWPDLAPIGVAFPASTSYGVTISGLGPYPSIDDAFGGGGLGASLPSEIELSSSPPIQVQTSP